MLEDTNQSEAAGRISDTREGAVQCPVCTFPDPQHHLHNLSRCDSCGHIFQTDLAVRVAYDAAYAHRYDSLPHRSMSALRWDFILSHLRVLPGSRVLDIGYGNGAFLKHIRQHGMDVYGIDVHGEDFGLAETSFADRTVFDIICFFDSLEHFPDFTPLLGMRARHVIVSLPATPDNLLCAPRQWRHYKPGEHLHYFSPMSLDRFMARWGFGSRLAAGYPEDALRGKLRDPADVGDGTDQHHGAGGKDNIYTAIYAR